MDNRFAGLAEECDDGNKMNNDGEVDGMPRFAGLAEGCDDGNKNNDGSTESHGRCARLGMRSRQP